MNLNNIQSLGVAATICLSAVSASTQITAQDTAAPYTSATWIDGSNQGFGFGPWTLTNNNGAGGGFAGKFVGASGVAAIDTSSKAFGQTPANLSAWTRVSSVRMSAAVSRG